MSGDRPGRPWSVLDDVDASHVSFDGDESSCDHPLTDRAHVHAVAGPAARLRLCPLRRREEDVAMTEDALLRAVLDMARLFGITTAHFRPALSQSGRWHTAVAGDGKGFPDLVLVGAGGVLYRELKTDKGRTSPEQVTWLRTLKVAGQDAELWKPADLQSGRIEAELRAIRRPANLPAQSAS